MKVEFWLVVIFLCVSIFSISMLFCEHMFFERDIGVVECVESEMGLDGDVVTHFYMSDMTPDGLGCGYYKRIKELEGKDVKK